MKVKNIILAVLGSLVVIVTGVIITFGIWTVYSKAAEYGDKTGRNIGKYNVIIVTTPSMEPAVKVGSISIVKRFNQEDIEVGDIIMFSNKYNENIVHRVIEIEKYKGQSLFVTKGDANMEPDGVLVDSSSYIGKVVVTANWLSGAVKQFISGTIVEYAVFKLLLIFIIIIYVGYKLLRQLVLFMIAVYYVFINKEGYYKYIKKFEVDLKECEELRVELESTLDFKDENILRRILRSSHLSKMIDSVGDIKDNKNAMRKRIVKYNKGKKKHNDSGEKA